MLEILGTREAMLESALLKRIANQSALQSIASWLFILHAVESYDKTPLLSIEQNEYNKCQFKTLLLSLYEVD